MEERTLKDILNDAGVPKMSNKEAYEILIRNIPDKKNSFLREALIKALIALDEAAKKEKRNVNTSNPIDAIRNRNEVESQRVDSIGRGNPKTNSVRADDRDVLQRSNGIHLNKH